MWNQKITVTHKNAFRSKELIFRTKETQAQTFSLRTPSAALLDWDQTPDEDWAAIGICAAEANLGYRQNAGWEKPGAVSVFLHPEDCFWLQTGARQTASDWMNEERARFSWVPDMSEMCHVSQDPRVLPLITKLLPASTLRLLPLPQLFWHLLLELILHSPLLNFRQFPLWLRTSFPDEKMSCTNGNRAWFVWMDTPYLKRAGWKIWSYSVRLWGRKLRARWLIASKKRLSLVLFAFGKSPASIPF